MFNLLPALHIQLIILFAAMFSIIIGGILCFKGYKSNMLIIIACGFYAGSVMAFEILRQFDMPLVTAAGTVIVGIAAAIVSYRFKTAREIIISGILLLISLYYLIGKTGFPNAGFSEKGFIVGLLISIIMLLYLYLFADYVSMISTALSGGGMIAVSLWAVSYALGNSLGTAVFVCLWLMVSAVGFLIHISIIHIDSVYTSSYILKRKVSNVIFQSYIPQGMQKSYENYCVYCGRPLEKGEKKCANCSSEDETGEKRI